jgi:hypothetical protein
LFHSKNHALFHRFEATDVEISIGILSRGVNNRAVKAGELTRTPLELINRIAALIPPPRTHRHRYYGALAPNSPLRAAVTAMAIPAQQPPVPKRSPAHYLWAARIARIYEVFPLLCPARGPPLWDGCEADAQRGEDAHIEPDGDLAAQPALDDEVDQRIDW